MAIAVTFTVSPAAPNHGGTVTATYAVTGNNPIGSAPIVVSGDVKVGSVDYQVSATLTPPGTPALPEVYAVPTCAGLTFVATSDPHVFTAVVA